jgi:hypothetical protein
VVVVLVVQGGILEMAVMAEIMTQLDHQDLAAAVGDRLAAV